MKFFAQLKIRWNALTPEARAILLIVLIFCLRLLWLGDMEFKGDERYTANYLATLGSRPFTPATEPSGHSGITLSNGFYYFLNIFPLDYSNPLNVIRVIAGLNASAVVLGLWTLRKNKTGFLAFALIGTSVTLIQGSRKIWYPDLVPFWINLGLALFLFSRETRRKWVSDALVAAAAFSFAVAGHMYMPGLLIGACVSGISLLTFLAKKDWRSAASWTVGLGIAGVTWLPYLIFMFSGAGAYGHSGGGIALDWKLFEPILRHMLTLPSTFPFDGLYLRAARNWVRSAGVNSSVYLAYHLTRALLLIAGLIGVSLFWVSIGALLKKWRQLGQSPVLVSLATLLILIPLGLFVSRLGSYVHYWLGVMPFAFYGIAWMATREEWPRLGLWAQRLAWTCCWITAAASLSFAVLVHEQKGFPGEYGPSFCSQEACEGR